MSKCTDCNEYNQEKQYCPKFCDVIRSTTEKMQEFYKGEHEKLEKIKQIIDSRDGFYLYDNLPPFQQIKEILEQDN